MENQHSSQSSQNDGEDLVRRKNLPSLRRAEKSQLPGFRMQARDYAVLKSVYEYRVLTAPLIECLHFPGTPGRPYSKKTLCSKRLKLLYHHAYLDRVEQLQRPHEATKPLLYVLDKQGALLVAEREGILFEELDWRPSDSQLSDIFLRHTLAVNEVRVAVEVSARKNGFEVVNWLDEKTLKNPAYREEIIVPGPVGKRQQGFLYPDGYFCLYDGNLFYHFFLEVDMATESIHAASTNKRDFLRKVHFYKAYLESGQFARKYNADRFAVLTFTQGETRTSNLKSAAEEFDRDEIFWFTSLESIQNADVLTEFVWQVAGWPDMQNLLVVANCAGEAQMQE